MMNLESVNGISNHFLFDIINKINNKRFARSIQKAVTAVGFKKYILLNDNDIYDGFHLKKVASPFPVCILSEDHLAAMLFGRIMQPIGVPLIKEVNFGSANSQNLATARDRSMRGASYVAKMRRKSFSSVFPISMKSVKFERN